MEKKETLKEEDKTSETTLNDSETEKKVEESESSLKEGAQSNEISNEEKVIELEDNTDLSGELACAGGTCEIDVDLKSLNTNGTKEEVSETQI